MLGRATGEASRDWISIGGDTWVGLRIALLDAVPVPAPVAQGMFKA